VYDLGMSKKLIGLISAEGKSKEEVKEGLMKILGNKGVLKETKDDTVESEHNMRVVESSDSTNQTEKL
jgi:hypothetical protein